jgi:selenocysteine lyase/cysteine desulfurase
VLDELKAPFAGVDKVHLNNAGVAPMCLAAKSAVDRVVARMLDGTVSVGEQFREYRAARATFAKLVGCEAGDVAFFHTCAAAISQAAWGVPLGRGDEIVISDEEYPSNAYPWHRAAERAGATVSAVPVERVLEAISPKTRVVAVSWVEFKSGSSVDLRALADAVHANDGWLVVDAIQGIGVVPFSLRDSGADLVCGGTHKWLLGPLAHGFLACAPGRAAQMQPLLVGAMTYGDEDEIVDPSKAPRADARRFEPGGPMLVGAVGGAAAIEVLLAIGIDRVGGEANRIAALVDDGARERGMKFAAKSGPVVHPIRNLIPRKKSAKEIVDAMRARGCAVAARAGGIRVAPHVHNGPQHVARFFELLDEIDR